MIGLRKKVRGKKGEGKKVKGKKKNWKWDDFFSCLVWENERKDFYTLLFDRVKREMKEKKV